MTSKAHRRHKLKQMKGCVIECLIILLGFAAALAFLLWLDPHCNLLRIPH